MSEEKTYGCRLTSEEEEYISQYYNCNFSRFVHEAIKNQKILIKRNKTKNVLSQTGTHVVGLGLGSFFIYLSLTVSGISGFLIFFLLGVFLITSNLISIIMEIKNVKFSNR